MVKDRSTAEDLLQEVWLRVNRAVEERPVNHLKPFIFQTARNLALDHLRARRLRAQTVIEDAPLAQVLSVTAPMGLPEDALHASRILANLSQSQPQPWQSELQATANICAQPPAWLQPPGNCHSTARLAEHRAERTQASHGDLHRRGVSAGGILNEHSTSDLSRRTNRKNLAATS